MDRELQKQLLQWMVEAPDDGMVQRVISRATALPQKRPFLHRLDIWLDSVFSDWQAGMAVKCASLALCALVGFSSGWQKQEALDVDITAVAFGIAIDGGGL